jgi:hypothetical protein
MPGWPGHHAALAGTGQAHTACYADFVRIFAVIFVKRFFSAKTSCTYTMNYLHQEKCFRDHGVDV